MKLVILKLTNPKWVKLGLKKQSHPNLLVALWSPGHFLIFEKKAQLLVGQNSDLERGLQWTARLWLYGLY